MHVLMVTSEAVPFAKSGGLADAVSALSKALRRLGHDVRIIMPRYSFIPVEGLSKLPSVLSVSMGGAVERAIVYKTILPDSDLSVYLLEHDGFFGRAGIYGSKEESDYGDNARRFAFLSRAAFRLCDALRWKPDIIHAHDWPASLSAVYRRYSEPAFNSTRTVLSIHNLGYQGIYSKDFYSYLGLPWELFHGAGFEYYDSINLLKAGITSAEQLSTVSPTYAREIQSPELGNNLDGLLRARSTSLVGILNGIDSEVWNPKTDSYLPANYNIDDISGKAKCKSALQAEFGLAEEADIPIIAMISRLTDQKGINELFRPNYGSIPDLCEDMDIQMVVLGTGEPWCEAELENLSSKLPNFKAKLGYSEKLAHLIEAGADFFLMPSRYEPCGLNQMYSLRYGTLPIARRTGGLADTISNFNEKTGAGTGFLFDALTPRAIYDTCGWAIWAYYNRNDQINGMRLRAMAQDFSWASSALEYDALYRSCLGI